MAFVSYDELTVFGLKGSSDNRGKVTESAQRQFRLIGDAPATDDEASARAYLASLGVSYEAAHPRLGTAYRCKDISVDRESQLTWMATAGYRTPVFDYNDPDPGVAYPWNQPATVDFFDIVTNGQIDEDVNGDPLMTAANEPIEGLTRDFSDLGIRIKRAFLTFSGAAYYTYKDAVNSDTYLGFAPGLLRVVGLTATQALFQGSIVYYDVQADIAVRKPYRTTAAKAWYLRVLHQGYMARPSSMDEPALATLPDGNYANKPILLDSDGVALADAGTPDWLEFEVYESAAFSGMGFF